MESPLDRLLADDSYRKPRPGSANLRVSARAKVGSAIMAQADLAVGQDPLPRRHAVIFIVFLGIVSCSAT